MTPRRRSPLHSILASPVFAAPPVPRRLRQQNRTSACILSIRIRQQTSAEGEAVETKRNLRPALLRQLPTPRGPGTVHLWPLPNAIPQFPVCEVRRTDTSKEAGGKGDNSSLPFRRSEAPLRDPSESASASGSGIGFGIGIAVGQRGNRSRSRLPIPIPDPDADADSEQGGGTRNRGTE
jgi:hypothetical protein